MKLFEYAVILHPTTEEKDNGDVATLIVPVTSCLATDEKMASMLAGRAIPAEHMKKSGRMEVVVRPF